MTAPSSMRPEYDFSQAVPNRYSKLLRGNNTQGPITAEFGKPQSRFDEQVVDWPTKHRFVSPGVRLLRLPGDGRNDFYSTFCGGCCDGCSHRYMDARP